MRPAAVTALALGPINDRLSAASRRERNRGTRPRRAVRGFANDPKFTAVCVPPRFVEGTVCAAESLVMAGKVRGGQIVGDAWNSRPALEAVRRERGS